MEKRVGITETDQANNLAAECKRILVGKVENNAISETTSPWYPFVFLIS